jgi:ATP phosphoribosyltransferase
MDCRAAYGGLEQLAMTIHRRHGRRIRVATKYMNPTQRFFAQHGVSDYRTVESLGATESATRWRLEATYSIARPT